MAEGRFEAVQCDFAVMLSPGMFEAFVLPELEAYHRAFGPIWYHLDGRDATQHLPCLLSLPWIRVVQYTPTPAEPPNGPEHLPLYRRIEPGARLMDFKCTEFVEELIFGEYRRKPLPRP